MKKLLWLTGMAWLSFQMAFAQWVNYPTPGVPRTKDGKPDLSAPAPKTADGKVDLSGIWQIVSAKAKPSEYEYNPSQNLENYMPEGATIPWQPWAEKLWRHRRETSGAGQPSERCLPPGVPHEVLIPLPFRIVHTPGVTFILREEFNHFRQVFTDGRPHPTERNPTWNGYSIGTWESDAFVVDTVGFNDLTWLDKAGHPHSEALHVIERYRRPSFGRMTVAVAIDDQKAYTKPWTVTLPFRLRPDTDLIESICENEKDAAHIAAH